MDERPVWQQPDTVLGSHRTSWGVSEQFGGGRSLDRHRSPTDRNAERIHLPSARAGVLLVVLHLTFRRRKWMVLGQWHVPDGRWATLHIIKIAKSWGSLRAAPFFVLGTSTIVVSLFGSCVTAACVSVISLIAFWNTGLATTADHYCEGFFTLPFIHKVLWLPRWQPYRWQSGFQSAHRFRQTETFVFNP